jgi:hypothetical protein
MRRVYLLLACFLLAAGNLASEPIKHPITGELGFFVSRAEMEQTVVALQERDLYLANFEKAMLERESLQIACKRKQVLSNVTMISEAAMIALLVLLCLLK